ncbi:MAG: hypothetical protein IPO22_13505 [Anaerolineales bacterium]|nr:hypothetical protein [Anaerolineales bacterium]
MSGFMLQLFQFFGLLPALGVAYIRDKFNFRLLPKTCLKYKHRLSCPVLRIFLAVLLAAPALIKINGHSPIIKAASCPSEMTMITIQYDPGTYVNVTKENIVFLDWMPNFHSSNFRRNAHNLADNNLIKAMESITPSTLFYTLDHETNTEALIIIATDELPSPGQLLVSLCGQWDETQL